ncbi:MAG TPA: hypothetical protein VGB13_05225 [Candidatus Krumholzibacteria bacterium]
MIYLGLLLAGFIFGVLVGYATDVLGDHKRTRAIARHGECAK